MSTTTESRWLFNEVGQYMKEGLPLNVVAFVDSILRLETSEVEVGVHKPH